MKKLFQIMLAIVAIVTMAMFACSCSPSSITSALNDYTGKLQTPEGIYLDEDNVLRWNSVPNAASYMVTIEEKDYERSTVACDLKKILKTNGTYEVFVKAKSDKINISDSDYSEGVTIKFTGAKADEGDDQTETKLFGEFEDILTKEAYIGYGYNVIDSSYVNANEVKWQYPIFDTEKLKQQRLLINKERNTNDEYISGNSMESYQENFMAKLESKLKVKKAFSASLKGKYESTSESTASALFYEYRHSTTYYRLYLQCDFQEYKNMLTDSFKRDLMNLDIPSLFQYYGTHLITSAAMGGRFDINYTMLSDKVIDTQKLSASMDTTLKAWSVDVNVDASAEISSKATSNNCTIHTESNTIGGGSVAMNNEKAILTNYQKWLSTIEESPALIGICDINSLYPIWNLLGDSNEEQARKKEISDYFTKYGDEAYRETLKMFNIKEPPKINDFSVVLLDENKKPLKDNVAMAGSTIYIKAIVDPEDAPISKSVTIKDSELYDLKYNSGDGSIYIKDGIPHNTIIYINVDIGGGFSKDLAIKVLGSYTVRFACDGGKTKDGEALSAIKVCNGDIIEAPEQIYKEGYVFKGWYTDEICSEENKFKFGRQTITADTILYAKWDTFCPTISFSSNIAGGALESVKVNYNEVFARPGDPTLEGYTFDGFYANEELTTPFDFSKAITEDTTIYLKWNINSYTVTFDPDGGSIVSGKNQVTVKYNSIIEAPVCSKVGAEFAGWYIDPDRTVLFDFANDKVKGNMTLYAKWANNLLTVKFDSGCDIKIDDRKINYNATLGVNFPSVDREGYKLIGWYKEESFKNKVTDATIFNDSNFENLSTEKVTTLYAKWEIKVYTITVQGIDVNPSEQIDSNGNLKYNSKIFGTLYYTFGDDIYERGFYIDKTLENKLPANYFADYFVNDEEKINFIFGGLFASQITDNGHTYACINGRSIPDAIDNCVLLSDGLWGESTISLDESKKSGTVYMYLSPIKRKIVFNYGIPPYGNMVSGTEYIDDVYYNESLEASITMPVNDYFYMVGYYYGDKKYYNADGSCSINLNDISGSGEIEFNGVWEKKQSEYIYLAKVANEDYDVAAIDSIGSTGYYLLIEDIDLGGSTWKPVATFSGTFNGGGHCIYNFIVNENVIPNSDPHLGFFAETKNTAIIRNLSLGKANYTTSYLADGWWCSGMHVGGIVANNNGIITNCYVNNVYMKGFVQANGTGAWVNVGGIAGTNRGNISKCMAKNSSLYSQSKCGYKDHAASARVGGIVGYNDVGNNMGNLSDCLSSGMTLNANAYTWGEGVNKGADADARAGGIVGYHNGGNGERLVEYDNNISATAVAQDGGNQNSGIAGIAGYTPWEVFGKTYSLENLITGGEPYERYIFSGIHMNKKTLYIVNGLNQDFTYSNLVTLDDCFKNNDIWCADESGLITLKWQEPSDR